MSAFAERKFIECRRQSILMLAARPLLDFLRDECTEICRRTCEHYPAEAGESGLQCGIGEAGIDFLVQLFDDLSGRIFRRANALPAARFKTGYEFGHRV